MVKRTGDAVEELRYRREQAKLGGGLKRQESIRISGRGTARDRIRSLLDEDSFVEIDTSSHTGLRIMECLCMKF